MITLITLNTQQGRSRKEIVRGCYSHEVDELKLFKEFKRLLTQNDIENVTLFPKFTYRNMTILGLCISFIEKEKFIINIASVIKPN